MLLKKIIFLIPLTLYFNGFTMFELFEKFPSKNKVESTEFILDKGCTILPTPYPYLAAPNKHITYIPEYCYSVIEKENEAAVLDTLRPCVGAFFTNKDNHPKKVLVFHKFCYNNPKAITRLIKKIFPGSIPENLYGFLFTTDMGKGYLQPIKPNEENKSTWQDIHQGRTQKEELIYIANVIQRYSKIPTSNLEVNLFKKAESFKHYKDYSDAPTSIYIDLTFQPRSISPTKESISERVVESEFILDGKKFLLKNNNNVLHDEFFTLERIEAAKGLKKYGDTDFVKITCINCGYCTDCTSQVSTDN